MEAQLTYTDNEEEDIDLTAWVCDDLAQPKNEIQTHVEEEKEIDQIGLLSAELAQSICENEKLKTELANMRSICVDQKMQQCVLQNDITRVLERCATLQKKCDRLTSQCTLLENNCADHKQKYVTLKNKYELLESDSAFQNVKKDKECMALTSQCALLENNCAEYKKKCVTLKNKCLLLTDERVASKTQIVAQQDEYKDLNEKCSVLYIKLRAEKETSAVLRIYCARLECFYKERCDIHREDIDELQQELDDIQRARPASICLELNWRRL